jgi:hypothetical protein
MVEGGHFVELRNILQMFNPHNEDAEDEEEQRKQQSKITGIKRKKLIEHDEQTKDKSKTNKKLMKNKAENPNNKKFRFSRERKGEGENEESEGQLENEEPTEQETTQETIPMFQNSAVNENDPLKQKRQTFLFSATLTLPRMMKKRDLVRQDETPVGKQ